MSSRDQVNRKHMAGLVAVVIVMIGTTAIRPRHITALGIANKIVPEQQLNTKAIDQIIGRSGELKGDVYKIGLPRTDLKVTAAGEPITVFLVLPRSSLVLRSARGWRSSEQATTQW